MGWLWSHALLQGFLAEQARGFLSFLLEDRLFFLMPLKAWIREFPHHKIRVSYQVGQLSSTGWS